MKTHPMKEDIDMDRLLYTEAQRQAAYKAGWDDHAAIVKQPIYAGTEWAGWTAVVRPDPDPRFVPGPEPDTYRFATVTPEPPTRIFLWIGVAIVVAAILLWVTLR